MSSPLEDMRFAVKAAWLGGLAVVVILVVSFFATAGFGLFSQVTAESRGQTGVREGTVANGQYRIARYNEFFETCNAIVQKKAQISDTQDLLKTDDETQKFYDQQDLRAQQGVLRDLVGQYNAKASQAGTAGQFRDSQLPASVETTRVTTCSTGS